MAVISRVRHTDKYQCVKLCIDKEKRGYECISPITKKYSYHKNFKYNGKSYDYDNTDQISYYEAVYKKGV